MPSKIIVIEDNNDILDMIAYILEDEGYEVIPSLNAEPLKDIETHRPDLILLDDWLPDGYGHKLCAQLKGSSETSHIPVLLVSSVVNLQDLAQKSKADGYIAKPFDIHHLIAMVKQHLQ
jgi:two-component system phosphate regulon response regulator PhoB